MAEIIHEDGMYKISTVEQVVEIMRHHVGAEPVIWDCPCTVEGCRSKVLCTRYVDDDGPIVYVTCTISRNDVPPVLMITRSELRGIRDHGEQAEFNAGESLLRGPDRTMYHRYMAAGLLDVLEAMLRPVASA